MLKAKESFVRGAAVLAVFGILGKLMGSVFRIPLTNIIGAEGMANYQVAYPVYALLIVVSTAGIPAAISRMVAERVSTGDLRGARRVFSVAFAALAVIGVFSSVLLIFASGLLANAVKMPSSSLSLIMISPAILFVSLLSAYRGYFQGLQMMTPTAVTQLVEQTAKLCAGLFLSWLWSPKGAEYGAAGALLGVALSELCALAVIIFIYRSKKKYLDSLCARSTNTRAAATRSILRDLAAIALPVTIGGCLMPAVGFADTLIVTNVMAAVDYSAYNPLSAGASFGVLTGSVNPLINMPAVISLALCTSLVPAVSEARAMKDYASLSRRSAFGLRLSLIIGFPCAAGFFTLASPVVSLLYSGGLTPDELSVAADLLRTLSAGVLFLTMLQTMTGILQGAGHQIIPLLSLCAGAAVKVFLSVILIKVPALNISGAAFGTVACYAAASAVNAAAVIKYAKPSIKIISGCAAPALSAAVMGIFAYFLYAALSPLGNTAAALISIAGAILVYAVMLLITGTIKKEDTELLPGGIMIQKLMCGLKLWEGSYADYDSGFRSGRPGGRKAYKRRGDGRKSCASGGGTK